MTRLLSRKQLLSTLRHPPWRALLVSSALGLLCYAGSTRTIESDARMRFANLARHVQTTIASRIKSYTDALRGSASLFQTADKITREQFRAYVVGLGMQRNFPALQSINYAEYVPGDQADQFIERERAAQVAHPFGNRRFAITPPGKRAAYSALTFIEGDKVALAAFGFDILNVPHAAQALLESRDTGVMITSGQAVAAISKPNRIGLAMRLPVYLPGQPLDTVEQRRAAYIGSVGIAFSVPEMVNGVLEGMPVQHVRLLLTDNGPGAAGRNNPKAPVRVLYDSEASDAVPNPPPGPDSSHFSVSLPVDYNGRAWTATFVAPKASLYSRFDEYFPWVATISGFVGSMLVYALLHTLTSSRSRALTMAEAMTRELRESEAKLQLSHQKLRRLVAHADQIKEGERKRIAREIHDDLGQNLLALRIEADMLASRTRTHHPRLNARARMTLSQIDTTIKSVRQIINDLRPNVLDLGLSAAVEWQIAEFRRRTGIRCELIVGCHDIRLPDSCSTAFFRILQESLTNIVRHANASSVRVELSAQAGAVTMSIDDNGVGLPGSGRNKPGSFGLVGIEERILILNGAFSIRSEEGHGTTVSVTVPADLAGRPGAAGVQPKQAPSGVALA
jgi:signal transduction histidine kinase